MLWIRVSPDAVAGVCTECSAAMADRLLPRLVVAVLEDLGDVVAALLHAHQAETEAGDDVADQVVRLLAACGEQQHVSGARQQIGRASCRERAPAGGAAGRWHGEAA